MSDNNEPEELTCQSFVDTIPVCITHSADRSGIRGLNHLTKNMHLLWLRVCFCNLKPHLANLIIKYYTLDRMLIICGRWGYALRAAETQEGRVLKIYCAWEIRQTNMRAYLYRPHTVCTTDSTHTDMSSCSQTHTLWLALSHLAVTLTDFKKYGWLGSLLPAPPISWPLTWSLHSCVSVSLSFIFLSFPSTVVCFYFWFNKSLLIFFLFILNLFFPEKEVAKTEEPILAKWSLSKWNKM